MIKKIIILMSIFWFTLTSQIFAVTLQTSTSVSPLYVGKIDNQGNFSGWKREVTLSENDRKVVFHIHSYANGGKITGLTSKLEDIRSKKFKGGSEYTVSGSVGATNAQTIIDTVKIYFKDSLEFNYSNYTWAIKLKGPNPEENEHFQSLPYGQIGTDILSEKGVGLGELEQDYRSNLLLYFTIKDLHKPVLINGLCSSEFNKCLKGNFVEYKDSDTSYIWRCRGLNGGTTDSCSIRKKVINGICENKINTCKAGQFLDQKDTKNEFIWICKGENLGTDQECKIKKEIFDGECGTKLNTCKKGKFAKYDDNEYYQRWKCEGKNGGADKICLVEKTCYCSRIKEAVDKCRQNNSVNYEEDTKVEKIGNVQGPRKTKQVESGGGWIHWVNYFILIFIIIILSIRLVTRKK